MVDRMANTITKTVTLGGSSSTSIEDAVRTVLARAAVTIDEITRFELKEVTGTVDGAGVPTSFDVTIDVTFVVKESVHG
jgi:flavin-binding protein dodecin